MKRIAQILILIVGVSLLAGCGGSNEAAANADGLAEFNEQGIAVLRGNLAGSSTSAGRDSETVRVEVPVKMDGMDVVVSVPFQLPRNAIIASSLTKQTDVLEYLSFNKSSSVFNAFPDYALVDVTFRKQAGVFVAISVVEAEKGFSLFSREPELAPVFSMDNFSQGSLQGRITEAYQDNGGLLLWKIAVPTSMQGLPVDVVLPVYAAADTQVVNTGDTIVTLDRISGNVQIDFTRRGDELTAHQITELP